MFHFVAIDFLFLLFKEINTSLSSESFCSGVAVIQDVQSVKNLIQQYTPITKVTQKISNRFVYLLFQVTQYDTLRIKQICD